MYYGKITFYYWSQKRLKRAADVIKNYFRSKNGARKSLIAFRSLPASPFTTRRFSLDSIVDVEIQNSHQNFVTAGGVKLAAHEKSLRYKIGYFRRKSKRPGFESSFQSKISTYMGNRFSLPVNNKIVRREPWSIGHKRRPRFGRSWVQISAKYLLNGSF